MHSGDGEHDPDSDLDVPDGIRFARWSDTKFLWTDQSAALRSA